MRRASKSALCFIAGFLLISTMIRSWVGLTQFPVVREQMDTFLNRKDQVDVIFLGSSRVLRDISPREFDQATKESGHNFRSFNLGVDAMSFMEARLLLDEILAAEPESLRHLVLEPTLYTYPVNHRTWTQQYESARTIASHRGAPSAMFFSYLFKELHRAGKNPWSDEEFHYDLRQHGQAFLKNFSNLGMLATRIRDLSTSRNSSFAALISERLGQFPMDLDPDRAVQATRIDFRSRVQKVEFETSALKTESLPDGLGRSQPYLEAIKELITIAEGRGIRVWLYTAPMSPLPDSRELAFLGNPSVLSFKSVHRYPALYSYENSFDGLHLTDSGSKELGRALAGQFTAALDRETKPRAQP